MKGKTEYHPGNSVMWMLVPLSPASDASLLMWNMELRVHVEIFGKCDLSHMFSVESIVDMIVPLRDVNHVFHVFSIVDSIVVTCDSSHLLQVDMTVVLRQCSHSQYRPWAVAFANSTRISAMRVYFEGLSIWEVAAVTHLGLEVCQMKPCVSSH